MSQDDPSIGDHVPLWRRIPPRANWAVYDHNLGRWTVTSKAFQNRKPRNAFSVCISCDAEDLGSGPEDAIAGHLGYGLAAFGAGVARQLGQAVYRVLEPSVLAHGHVAGHKTRKTRRDFAAASRFLISPEE